MLSYQCGVNCLSGVGGGGAMRLRVCVRGLLVAFLFFLLPQIPAYRMLLESLNRRNVLLFLFIFFLLFLLKR